MGTVHIIFSGGVMDGQIQSHLDPPDPMQVLVEQGDDYEVVHEYRMLRLDPGEPPMRGQNGLWVFTGIKQRDKGGEL